MVSSSNDNINLIVSKYLKNEEPLYMKEKHQPAYKIDILAMMNEDDEGINIKGNKANFQKMSNSTQSTTQDCLQKSSARLNAGTNDSQEILKPQIFKDLSSKIHKQLLFNNQNWFQTINKDPNFSYSYFNINESGQSPQNLTQYKQIQQFYLDNEKDNKISEIDSSLNDMVQVTESSWIDWDDKKKLESHISIQKSLESSHRFDPSKYFGGLKVQDLTNPPDDPRFYCMLFQLNHFRNYPVPLRSPNQMSLITSTQTLISNIKHKQTLSKNGSPSQKILKQQTSISKILYQQLESSLEKTKKKLQAQKSTAKINSEQKLSPRTHFKSNSKIISSQLSNNKSKLGCNQTQNPNQAPISNGIYSIKHCLSTGTSPIRILDNQNQKPKQILSNNKPRNSPFSRLKSSKDDTVIKMREKLSPKMLTAASKYMKNATRLHIGTSSSKKMNNSQVQIIKSFLSQGQVNALNNSKDSSLTKSIDNTNQKSSILYKSTEKIFVDLSSCQSTSLNQKLSSMIHSPVNLSQQKKSQKALIPHSTQQLEKKNQTRLNSAIYETLVVNKTSMLKKTISELEKNQLDNSKQRNDSRNNIPKPNKSSSRKLQIETMNSVQNFSTHVFTPKHSQKSGDHKGIQKNLIVSIISPASHGTNTRGSGSSYKYNQNQNSDRFKYNHQNRF
ncbi:UNKNOWN [Stylonychia lemnae]|uniref:Uncharacterized protein n=1 Tax=Stylonychia lemnae TaxID=5949 RepID=A0A077ZMA6_STYLE|nr:UNKNOWN [Stylonychia lemnae]|eukprot:CDW71103.1 UNKNOWN [Stylonychia lemnae]